MRSARVALVGYIRATVVPGLLQQVLAGLAQNLEGGMPAEGKWRCVASVSRCSAMISPIVQHHYLSF